MDFAKDNESVPDFMVGDVAEMSLVVKRVTSAGALLLQGFAGG